MIQKIKNKLVLIKTQIPLLNYLSKRKIPVQTRIENALAHKSSVFFVHIGANDGVQADPIHTLVKRHSHWRGIFVEPVSFVFARLRANYPDSDRFIFENAAISREEGKQTIYSVSEKARQAEMSFWPDQLGSFTKEHILSHFGLKVIPFIVAEEVECISFSTLCQRNSVKAIDVLVIDVEGHEYIVLSQIDFARYQPLLILVEHKYLSPADKKRVVHLLKSNAYKIIDYGYDFLATHQSKPKRL